MKNKTFFTRVAGICVGIIMLVAYLLTGTHGLSKKDKDTYANAIALQPVADEIGFVGYDLKDYTIAFYDGDKEYALQSDGTFKERKPVLGILVATAYPVGDHVEIIVPVYEQFENVVNLGTFGLAKSDDKTQEALVLSAIWHEGFHAWQLTKHLENVGTWGSDAMVDNAFIDDNPQVRTLYEQQMSLLKQAAYEKDPSEVKDLARKILSLEAERQQLVPLEVLQTEIKEELTEGSATYFESQIFLSLCGQEAYEEYYLSYMDQYKEGRNKYYTLGMAKCLLLDKLNPTWKNVFVMDTSFNDMLRVALASP